jgi:thioredoxin-dependent peroxiredoxin
MMTHKRALATALGAALLAIVPTQAQQPAPAPTYTPPEVGAMAPDFELPGATRYGLLRDPVRLSDNRGKTVVLAFFYRARTKG